MIYRLVATALIGGVLLSSVTGSTRAAPARAFHGSCTSFRSQLWNLNGETAKSYALYGSFVKQYNAGTLTDAMAVSLMVRLRVVLDGGNVGSPALHGLVQLITTTNYRFGLQGWANVKGPYAWAAFKTWLAADDLSTVVDAIVRGQSMLAIDSYQSIYSEGKRNIGYAWDALKQLACKK